MTEPTSPNRSKRWIKIILVLSLGLNLMVAGLVVGAALNGGKDRGGPPDRREAGFGPLSRALASDDRRRLGREIRRATRDISSETRQDWQTVLSALRNSDFDAEVLKQFFALQRDANVARMSAAQQTLIDHISQLDPGERAAFADRLERALERSPRRQNN